MTSRPLLAFLVVGLAAAQQLPDVGKPADPPQGAPAGMATVDRTGLRDHVFWLADDERAGRYTASAAQVATAEYIAAHFDKLGLKPLGDRGKFLQSYPLERTFVDKATQLTFGKVKVKTHFAVLASDDGKTSVSGKFAWCGRGLATDLPASLKGRIPIVVFDNTAHGRGAGGDIRAVNQYRQLARQLDRRGAKAGVVLLPGDPGTLGNTLNYNALLPDHAKLKYGGSNRRRGADFAVPLFVVAGPAVAQLVEHVGGTATGDGLEPPDTDKIKARGKLVIAVKTDKTKAVNVVAALEGKGKKSEAIVISAHHDHVGMRLDGDAFNGADDNASGTAGLLELAEAFAKGEPPDRTIVFLSVSGEELGLWGSDYYASNPGWPLDRTIANVNIDMIGRAVAKGDGIEMQVTPSPEHEKYNSLVKESIELGKRLGVSFVSGDQYYGRSDHYNFAKKGVPVVFFCDGEHPDYHQVTDEAAKLDFAGMESVARLAYWVVWETSQAAGRPKKL